MMIAGFPLLLMALFSPTPKDETVVNLGPLLDRPLKEIAPKLGSVKPIFQGFSCFHPNNASDVKIYEEAAKPGSPALRVFQTYLGDVETRAKNWVESLQRLGFRVDASTTLAPCDDLIMIKGVKGLPPKWRVFYREPAVLYFAQVSDEDLRGVTLEKGLMYQIASTLEPAELATHAKSGFLEFANMSFRHRKLFLLTGTPFPNGDSFVEDGSTITRDIQYVIGGKKITLRYTEKHAGK